MHAAAIRHVTIQTGINLSSIPSTAWHRLIDVHYQRLDKDNRPHHNETTVIYVVTGLEACVPSLKEWPEVWAANNNKLKPTPPAAPKNVVFVDQSVVVVGTEKPAVEEKLGTTTTKKAAEKGQGAGDEIDVESEAVNEQEEEEKEVKKEEIEVEPMEEDGNGGNVRKEATKIEQQPKDESGQGVETVENGAPAAAADVDVFPLEKEGKAGTGAEPVGRKEIGSRVAPAAPAIPALPVLQFIGVHSSRVKLKTLEISLDGMLDYDENDREEGSFELSLAAEVIKEAVIQYHGRHILQQLEILR